MSQAFVVKNFDVKYCESDNLLYKYLHLNKIYKPKPS